MVRSHGGTVQWRASERAKRAYASVEIPDGVGVAADALRAVAQSAVTVWDGAVIALAVFPALAEALPPLLDALAGPGRPAGVISCDAIDGGIAVEWDPERTGASVVLGTIDVELSAFACGRTAELLTPLTAAWAARIAAEGLQAPQIAPDRMLETLLERAGLHD